MAAIGSTTEELRTVLNAHEVPEEVMLALGHPPFKVTTLRQFANFFGNRNEVKVLSSTRRSGRMMAWSRPI